MSDISALRLHPESTADPLTLRWVADTWALDEPTPAMAALIRDGILAAVEIGAGEIRTRLSPGRSWARDGDRVRSVLFQALSNAEAARAADAGAGAALSGQIAELIRREVAPFVDSHGGDIAIVSLDHDTLTVSLGGACGHCSLRTGTLRNVVAKAVQAKFPQIRRIRAVRT